MSKTKNEAYNLIEKMTHNNYKQSNERTPSKKTGGKFDVDDLTQFTAKMDAMT